MRALACATAVIGGACWVANFFVGADILSLVGLVLLGIAALLAGLTSVPKAPVWLQGIVALGSLGLFAAVTSTLQSALPDDAVQLGLGIVAIVVFGYLWFKRPRAQRPTRRAGTHAR
jgi:ABC-type uncharacterized transport system permease subunit